MPRKIKTLERNDKTPRFLALIIPCLNVLQRNATPYFNFLICQSRKNAKNREKSRNCQRHTTARASLALARAQNTLFKRKKKKK